MKNWKYLTFAGLMMLGIAGGAVACGDSGAGGSGGSGPPSCTQPSDCDSGACDTKCSVCIGTTCDATHPCTDTTKECRAACEGGATQCLDPVWAVGARAVRVAPVRVHLRQQRRLLLPGRLLLDQRHLRVVRVWHAVQHVQRLRKRPGRRRRRHERSGDYRLDADQQVDLDNDANIHCRKKRGRLRCAAERAKFHGYYIPASGQTVSSTGAYRKIYLTSSTSCTSDTDCGGSDAGKCVEGKCGS